MTYRSEVLADNPILYWRLNEAAGTSVAFDSSGNGRHGTIANAAAILRRQTHPLQDGDSDNYSMRLGELAAGNVKDRGVSISRSAFPSAMSRFTLSFWVKQVDNTTDRRLVTWDLDGGDSSSGHVAPFQVNGGLGTVMRSQGSQTVAETSLLWQAPWTDADWHHYALLWGEIYGIGTGLAVYLDGNLIRFEREDIGGWRTVLPTAAMVIGSGGGQGGRTFFKDVAMWSAALNPARIAAHVKAGLAVERLSRRLYLPSSGAPSPAASPAFGSVWNSTVGATRLRTSDPEVRSETPRADIVLTKPTPGPSNVLARQWVSPPLRTATTLKGRFGVSILGRPGDVYVVARLQAAIRVITSSGTVRGTVIDSFESLESSRVFEGFGVPNSTVTNRLLRFDWYSYAPIAMQAGDRIVVELGAYFDNSTAAGEAAELWIGDPASGPDLPFRRAAATSGVPYVEILQALDFDVPLLYESEGAWEDDAAARGPISLKMRFEAGAADELSETFAGTASFEEITLPKTVYQGVAADEDEGVDEGSYRIWFPDEPDAPGGGVIRWTLRDRETNQVVRLAFNPNEASPPTIPRNFRFASGTSIDGRRIRAMAQPPSPTDWTFGGVILDKAAHDVLESWAERDTIVRITDHLSRTFEVVLRSFEFKERRPTPLRPWRGTYTMTCFFLKEIR